LSLLGSRQSYCFNRNDAILLNHSVVTARVLHSYCTIFTIALCRILNEKIYIFASLYPMHNICYVVQISSASLLSVWVYSIVTIIVCTPRDNKLSLRAPGVTALLGYARSRTNQTAERVRRCNKTKNSQITETFCLFSKTFYFEIQRKHKCPINRPS